MTCVRRWLTRNFYSTISRESISGLKGLLPLKHLYVGSGQIQRSYYQQNSFRWQKRQVKQQDFIKTVTQALDKSALDPKYLEIEITESILQDAEAAIPIMYKLKAMGIRISLDDFGMGYSSFKYLKSFPLDVIKIDRYFISDVATNSDSATIIKAIIAMTHALKLKVVAEGAKT